MKSAKYTLSALFCAFFLFACSPAEQETAEVQLRILETTDIHAYLAGYNYFEQAPTHEFGLAHTAHLIHQARAEQPNNLLFDNGDLIQGSPLGDWVARQGTEFLDANTHPVIDALNYLDYDAANIGNHEFNFGLPFIEATLAGANFPYVTANVFYQNSEATDSGWRTEGWENPFTQPYVILERDFTDTQGDSQRIKVGVIGFVPPQILTWDASHLTGKVYVRDMVAAAHHFVPKMREEGADIVIAIPHAGLNDALRYDEFTEQATREIAKVPGIDAILFGHQHQVFPGSSAYDNLPGVDNVNGYINGVPAVQPGYWGNHLGVIDLVLQKNQGKWQVASSRVELRAVTENYDPELAARFASAHEATLNMLNEPLAELNTAITSYFARVFPDTSTEFINAAQTWYGERLQAEQILPSQIPVLSAAAPFRTGSQNARDYTHIEAGTVTLGDLAALYIYPNTLQAVQINGATLKDWLEMSALAFNTVSADEESQPLFSGMPSFNFDVISGVHYEFDLSQPPRFDRSGALISEENHRVVNLTYQGNPVSPPDDSSHL